MLNHSVPIIKICDVRSGVDRWINKTDEFRQLSSHWAIGASSIGQSWRYRCPKRPSAPEQRANSRVHWLNIHKHFCHSSSTNLFNWNPDQPIHPGNGDVRSAENLHTVDGCDSHTHHGGGSEGRLELHSEGARSSGSDLLTGTSGLFILRSESGEEKWPSFEWLVVHIGERLDTRNLCKTCTSQNRALTTSQSLPLGGTRNRWK